MNKTLELKKLLIHYLIDRYDFNFTNKEFADYLLNKSDIYEFMDWLYYQEFRVKSLKKLNSKYGKKAKN